MPPRILFTGKLRPNGFEFAACDDCNQKTKMADLFAALVCRAYPDAESDREKADMKKILGALSRNLPDVLSEMNIGRADQKTARKETKIAEGGGFLRMSGPIATRLLDTFAHKLGLAMHYETTGKILPVGGGVATRIFSNVDAMQDQLPNEIFSLLPKPSTLQHGSWDVGNQFKYSMRITDDEQMGLFFATFRYSISILAITANNIAAFTTDRPESMQPRTPASLWM